MTQPATLVSPAVVSLGQCWGTPNGQDLSSPSYMATGLLCVAESILRHWSTGPKELIDDPSYGRNATDLLSDDLSPTDIAYEQQQFAAEAMKDERVATMTVKINLITSGLLNIVGEGTTAAGPFRLVVGVSANPPPGTPNVQLLLVSP